jgi:hypothetical protein
VEPGRPCLKGPSPINLFTPDSVKRPLVPRPYAGQASIIVRCIPRRGQLRAVRVQVSHPGQLSVLRFILADP